MHNTPEDNELNTPSGDNSSEPNEKSTDQQDVQTTERSKQLGSSSATSETGFFKSQETVEQKESLKQTDEVNLNTTIKHPRIQATTVNIGCNIDGLNDLPELISLVDIAPIFNMDIDGLVEVFVKPPSWQHAISMCGKKHLIILQGEYGIGKWSSAVQLCRAIKAKKLYEVRSTSSFAAMARFKFEANCAYIMDCPVLPDTHNNIRFDLNKIIDRLNNLNAHLFITFPPDIQLPPYILAEFVIPWKAPEDRNLLLQKHLLHRLTGLSNRDDYVTKMLEHEHLQDIIISQLLPAEAAELASRLAAALTEKHLETVNVDLVISEVADKFKVDIPRIIHDLFETDQVNNATLAFAITAAMLNGTDYQTVLRASHTLETTLFAHSKEDTAKQGSRFGMSRAQLLETTGAILVDKNANMEYGEDAVKCIRMRDPLLSSQILSYTWRYDDNHSPILRWITDNCHELNTQAREQIVTTVVELWKMEDSFENVLNEVVKKLANSNEMNSRTVASQILNKAVKEPLLAFRILKLLHHWITISDNTSLLCTAVVAYGSGIGLLYPKEALQDIRAIVETGEVWKFHIACQGLANLLSLGKGDSEYATRLIPFINTWNDENQNKTDKVKVRYGLLVFHYLMSQAEISLTDEAELQFTPLLLNALPQEEEIWGQVALLIASCFTGGEEMSREIAYALRAWIRTTEVDTELFPVLCAVVSSVANANSGRLTRWLCAYLRSWAREDKNGCAMALLSHIQRIQ